MLRKVLMVLVLLVAPVLGQAKEFSAYGSRMTVYADGRVAFYEGSTRESSSCHLTRSEGRELLLGYLEAQEVGAGYAEVNGLRMVVSKDGQQVLMDCGGTRTILWLATAADADAFEKVLRATVDRPTSYSLSPSRGGTSVARSKFARDRARPTSSWSQPATRW